MDQAVVVGVGNIYAAEPVQGRHQPAARGGQDLARTLPAAGRGGEGNPRLCDHPGGTTLRDFISPDGAPGYFEQELLVYGRDGLPCPNCGRALKHATIGQRASVWCNHCQR